MDKLNRQEYEQYWKGVHNRTLEDDLCYVMFPDKPRYYNLFFDRIERYAVKQWLRKENVALDGKNLLDIGCGRGRWLRFFRCQGAETTGIDLSEEAVGKCTANGLNAICGSIADMDMFQDEQFDIVTSITVLLHLPYELKECAIKEIGRVVKKGGKIVLIENTWDDPSPHVFSYDIEQWVNIFNKYGMKMIFCSAHCFNLCRRRFPCSVKWIERLAIYMDYIFDFVLMKVLYGKRSNLGLQHFMVFERK